MARRRDLFDRWSRRSPLSTLQISDITRARVKRWLNVIEFLVVVDLLVVLFGALGVYEKMGGVF